MKKTTTTAIKKLKLGTEVKWKSGANGNVKNKTGKIVAVLAPGKTPAAKRFPNLRAAKARNITTYIVDVKGRFYRPRTSLLTLA